MIDLARLQTYFTANAASHDQPVPVVVPLPPELSSLDTASSLAPNTTLVLATTEAPSVLAGLQNIAFVVLSCESALAAVRDNLDVNARGFDPAAPPATDAEAMAFRATLVQSRAVTALLDGVPVAAGMWTPPVAGVAELAGITTLAAYRGRGIGAALASELTRSVFAHGVDTAMLHTANPVASRVYQRIGFRPVALLASASNEEAAS